MKPDYQAAAEKATEILIKHGIKAAPIDPLPILKNMPGVLVVSFEEMSKDMGMDRKCVISMFGKECRDAFTSVNLIDGKKQYLVTYNAYLPFHIIQRSLARELGHIVLGHDGTKPEEVRLEEAKCFAHHLLCPRPLIHAIQATGIRLTTEVIGSITSFNDHCLFCLRRTPATDIPADWNRKIRDNMMPYIVNFFEFQRTVMNNDGSALADLGTYMEGYAE